MELASKYNPADVEGKWYQYWLDHKLFSSKPDGREPYTVVIPPPNVTGVLHMGHMLNNTIQDILVRRARMMGKNACWVPGTDHASIATEAKVVNRLAQQGIKKTDLTREEFLKHAWAWTEEHGGIILHRLSRCHRTAAFFIECPVIRAISPCFQHCHIVIIRSIGDGIDLRNRNQITTDRASRIIWCKMVKIIPHRLRIHLPAQLFIHNRENPLFQFFIKISLVHIPRDTAGYQREEIVPRVGISDVRRVCILVII